MVSPAIPPAATPTVCKLRILLRRAFSIQILLQAAANATQNTCTYIDLNPITSLNNYGHNYFLSQNPYTLNSYAGFGEVYYNVASDVKLTGGLRWTEDRKHFIDIPSEVITKAMAISSRMLWISSGTSSRAAPP